jgi:hypothetical protein
MIGLTVMTELDHSKYTHLQQGRQGKAGIQCSENCYQENMQQQHNITKCLGHHF